MNTLEQLINNMSNNAFEIFINQFADLVESNEVTTVKVIELAKASYLEGLNR